MTGREEYSEKKKGLIGTIVFHFIVLMMLLLLGFFTPLPLPGEEGILVNFGNSDNGLGNQEPAPARRQRQNPAPPKTEEKKTTPPPTKTTPPPPVTKSEPEPAKEVAMTQDYEETVAINAAEKKKQEELEAKRKKDQEELKRRQEVEAARKRQEEIERQKQAEIERQKREEERLAREEAERKAQEEAERQRKAEEERRINEINSRTAGAFAKSGDGSGGEGSGTGKSQGVTFPGGNQGVPTGDPNADKYGPGGSGSGDAGSGVSFSLSGRSIKSIAKPEHPGGDSGKVVVKITVDRNGNVISALPGAPGTTISGQSFHNHAKQAALKTKFNVANDAPAHQSGTITYIFSYQ